MSFLTSFRFFFSTACPVDLEAAVAGAIGCLISRSFDVRAGVLCVRRLAILESFPALPSHHSALPLRGWRSADRAPALSDVCVASVTNNPPPSSRLRLRRWRRPPRPTQQVPQRPRAENFGRSETDRPSLVLAIGREPNQLPPPISAPSTGESHSLRQPV